MQRGLFKAFFNLERAYFNMRLANNSSDQMSPRRVLGENVSRKLEQKVMEKKTQKTGQVEQILNCKCSSSDHVDPPYILIFTLCPANVFEL